MAQQNTRDQERSATSSSGTQGGQGGTAAKRSMAPASNTRDQEITGDRGINGASDKNLIEQVKNTAAGAYGTATSKATEKLEEQKSTLTSSLTSVADNIRKLGQNLGEEGSESGLTSSASTYTDTAADKIEQAARYFERHDVEAIYHDVEDLARQNPAIFIGGAFALGFLAARFLKSSNTRSLSDSRGRRSLTGETRTSFDTQNSRTTGTTY